MTIDEAVAILNERRHHGHQGWYVSGPPGEHQLVFGEDRYEWFEPFEVVAIAEKYVRDGLRPRARARP